MTVARVALAVATAETFDYWVPSGIDVVAGAIVKVPLGPRRVAGVVADVAGDTTVPRERLLPIDEVIALPPLPDDVRALCEFVATYYQVPPGLAYALAIPPLRARTARQPRTASEPTRTATKIPALNDDQLRAVDAIVSAQRTFAPFLLQGITGSGKTDVYLAVAARSVASGGQALMLVPEINLTPQLVARVRDALPGATTVTLHSGLAAGERAANWRAAAEGTADVVLGTRLAVFTPLPRLSLIVVDEEHDGSYKQQDTVRYHARDLALWRGRRRAVPVVLGSATPSLETYANADAARYTRLVLPRRADPRAVPPIVRFVAARGERIRDGLSPELIEGIGSRFDRNEQSLVFVNRRGFAPALKCVACAWEAGCPRCSARLVTHHVPSTLLRAAGPSQGAKGAPSGGVGVHRAAGPSQGAKGAPSGGVGVLICHHCGKRERMPRACPQCGNVDLLPGGYGTQRLEQALAAAFPHARIARVDRDSTRRRGAFDAVRAQVEQSALDILVGTQMLAKGHHFARLTLVGVLGADNALYSADFRATERLAALMVQVAGRAGRAGLPGEVIVQTDFPGHPVYATLARHDYDSVARALLAERRASGLPPFAHLALLSAEAHRRDDAEQFLAAAHADALECRRRLRVDVDIFAPVAAPLARRAGYERSQMLLRSARRSELQRLLTPWHRSLDASASRRVRWSLDVDPPAVG